MAGELAQVIFDKEWLDKIGLDMTGKLGASRELRQVGELLKARELDKVGELDEVGELATTELGNVGELTVGITLGPRKVGELTKGSELRPGKWAPAYLGSGISHRS